MQSKSFLSYKRVLEKGHNGCSNCLTRKRSNGKINTHIPLIHKDAVSRDATPLAHRVAALLKRRLLGRMCK
ncbi:MAG: hypothetical protein P4M13_01475 [Alphaproteobacteria bacterium]|nr:hypothetical protein [Alphaproteobacteria bacterium]